MSREAPRVRLGAFLVLACRMSVGDEANTMLCMIEGRGVGIVKAKFTWIFGIIASTQANITSYLNRQCQIFFALDREGKSNQNDLIMHN